MNFRGRFVLARRGSYPGADGHSRRRSAPRAHPAPDAAGLSWQHVDGRPVDDDPVSELGDRAAGGTGAT